MSGRECWWVPKKFNVSLRDNPVLWVVQREESICGC